MMSTLVKQKSLRVSGVRHGLHISRVTSDRVWISDYNNLILTNTAGDKLHHLIGIDSAWGIHTVTSEGALIYIGSECNINKLSTNNKLKTTLIKYKGPWRPQSVYSSPSTRNLLVGMFNTDTYTSKVTRYNSTGESIQSEHHDNTDQGLYDWPRYITENRNGDVIVSDWHRVVVTDRGGEHRFSYTGPPSGSKFLPIGICTDELSHILVCDQCTCSVQILDQDGSFLSHIQTSHNGIYTPWGLSYDENTHSLWVGSEENNNLNIYRCFYGESLTDLPLENMKCKNHPSKAAETFCMECDVPLCVDCTPSKEHSEHVKLYHKIKGADEGRNPGIDFADDSLDLTSIFHHQKLGGKQVSDNLDFKSFEQEQKNIEVKQISKEGEEESKIGTVVGEGSSSEGSDGSPVELSDLSDEFSGKDLNLQSSIYQQKDVGNLVERENGERTSCCSNLSINNKLEQLREHEEYEFHIQRLINYLNIENTHHLSHQGGHTESTEFVEIIQRVDYLDCSGLYFSNAEKQSKSLKPFSQSSVDDFLGWMADCDDILRKTRSAKCRFILSILFSAYTKKAVLEFKSKNMSLIIDHCLDYAFKTENHILATELVRSYIFEFDFHLQKIFQDKEMNSAFRDTFLTTAKFMILRVSPRLRQNSIKLSFCSECSQESRLVIMMSYKGIIEKKHRIPEKAMGVEIVLFNYTQRSRETSSVFNNFTASFSSKYLPVITEKDARMLFKKHSNLTVISASPFKSTGYLKGKHRVVNIPCINLLCLHKGFIPFGEGEFPKQIHGFDVDVQEGYCFLGSGRSIDFGGHICRARGINTPGHGSIGGFVDLSNDSVGLITCAHVVFSTDELKKPNNELENYVFVRGTDLTVEFFDKSQHNFQVCGNIVNKHFPLSINDNSVDAALIKLDPSVNEYAFPVALADQLYSAGFDPDKPPVFSGEVISLPYPDPIHHVSSRIPERLDSVIKYGSKTGFTIGSLYFDGVHIRLLNENLDLPDQGSIVPMYNQIEIKSLPHGAFFEVGDSGAFVFCINQDKTLSCLGMAIGLTSSGSCLVTPMVRILDSFGLPHRLKPCSPFISRNISPVSEDSTNSQLKQQNNDSSGVDLGAILLNLQTSITNMQTSMASMQSSITDVQNQQTCIQTSLQSVQAEVGNLKTQVHAEVCDLKAQIQEIKDEFHTKSSTISSDIKQN